MLAVTLDLAWPTRSNGNAVAPDVALLFFPELLLLRDPVQAVEDAASAAAAVTGRHDRLAAAAPARGRGMRPLRLSIGRVIVRLRADAALAARVANDFRAAQGLFKAAACRRPARALLPLTSSTAQAPQYRYEAVKETGIQQSTAGSLYRLR